MQPIVLDRPFSLWTYGISLSQLVLRSRATESDDEQLTVHFFAVRAAEVRSRYRPLVLTETESASTAQPCCIPVMATQRSCVR